MNFILFNGQLTQPIQIDLSYQNRAFAYADGFFDTIIYAQKEFKYIEYHFDRISRAIKEFKFELNQEFNLSYLSNQLALLLESNNIVEKCRIRIEIWRKNGGLYAPLNNGFDWLAYTNELKFMPLVKEKVGLFRAFPKTFSPISFCKNINSNPYTFALLEASEKGLDDMLLFNPFGEIVESSSANVFFIVSDTIITPPISAGCIDGIMRTQIIKWCLSQNIILREQVVNESILEQCSAVFIANVVGVSAIKQIENQIYNTQHPFTLTLQELFNIR